MAISPRIRTSALIAAAAAVVLAWPAIRLDAIGPSVMMFYGPNVKQTVFVTGADLNTFPDLVQTAKVTADDVAGRPYITVAIFWGPASDPATNGTRMADLKPEMAWQHGRYYRATAQHPGLLLVTQFTKTAQGPPPASSQIFTAGGPVSAAAIAVLRRWGIEPPGGQSSGPR